MSTRRTAAAVLAAAALLAGCTLGTGENDPGGGAINPQTVPLAPVAEREAAPDVCGETLDGEQLCIAELAGQPALVNFWASWCGPCATEVPELVDVAERYEGRLRVVGVNLADTRVNARSFERDQQVTYPSIFDQGAQVAARFGGVAPSALPSTFLLDAEGRVAVTFPGAVSEALLEPYLADLLAEAAS